MHLLRRVVQSLAVACTAVLGGSVGVMATPATAHAQPPGSSLWNATLTIAPAPSPFLSDWARNPTIARLSIFYSGTTGESYRVEAIITERRRGELGRGISGVKDIAFGPTSAQLTTQDLVDWAAFNYDPSLRSQIVRTGLLPEGDYQICARIRNQFGGALLTQACSDFRIAYPESPQLIAPATGSGVSVAQPTFQWVPVQAPAEAGVRYRLRIAKRLPGQAPAIALQANVPQHEGETGGAAFYVYPLDALPLDTGATYVWQVQTLTRDGVPFSAGGRPSEIWSFAWGPGGVGGPRRVADRPFADTLTLVPGIARLRGLSLVNATESDFDVRLDGAAVLEITPPGSSAFTVPVDVRGLTVDRVAGLVTGISAGRVLGRFVDDRAPAAWRVPLVRFTNVEWAPGTGLTFGGSLDAPNTPPMRGRVALTAQGLDGVLLTEAGQGTTVLALGSGAATLDIGTARAAWPAGDLRLDGRVLLFGREAGCRPVSLTLSRDASPTPVPVSCDGTLAVPLVAGTTRPLLAITAASLTLQAEPSAGRASFDGRLSGALVLDGALPSGAAPSLPPCEVRLALRLAGDSVVADRATDPCDAARRAAAGWVQLAFTNLRVERLTWRRADGFDLAGLVDVQPAWRAGVGAPLPYLADVRLARDGFEWSATTADVADTPVPLGGFVARFARIGVTAGTWSWRDYGLGQADALRFTGSGRLTFATEAPACLREPMAFEDAAIGGGRVRVPLRDASFGAPCPVPMGTSALEVTGVGGVLSAALGDSTLRIDTLPGATARVRWPAAWQCADGAGTTALAAPMPLAADGRARGAVRVGDVACPVPTAPFALQLLDATLTADDTTAGRRPILRGGAGVRLPGGGTVAGQGRVAVDVDRGTLLDGTLAVSGAARLELPRRSPMLSFELAGFTMTREGLLVDGRQTLLLDGGSRIGSTFISVLVDTSGQVRRGGVRFDTTFALVGPAQASPVPWRAVPAGQAIATTGVRFDWPLGVRLDSLGLHGGGTSRGALRVDDVRVADAAFIADDRLAVGVSAERPIVGRGEWRVAGEVVAVLDADGARLEGAAVARAALPARLALPSLNGAWLETRRGDTLLVETQLLPNGIRVRTPAGRAATLVLPVFAATEAAAPRVPVQVDLTYDGLYETLTAGRVTATDAAGLANRLDLASVGLPLSADSLSLDVTGGVTVLRVHGRPVLFGAAQGRAHALAIGIGGDGSATLEGTAALDARVPLVPQGPGAWYTADSIGGRAVRRLGVTTVDLAVQGRLELGNVGDARWRAPLAVQLTERGVTVGTMGAADSGDARLDAGGLRVRLARVAVPRLSWSPAGFDFEFQLEGPLEVPSLGIVTPAVRGLSLVPRGLAVPSVLVPELTADPVLLAGWRVQGRALRVRPGVLPIFGGTASATVSVDVSIGFGRMPTGAPPELQSVRVSALDVVLREGRLVGAIEPRTLSPTFAVPLPNDAALRIAALSGALEDSAGTQRVRLEAAGVMVLPSALRCAAGDTLSLGTSTVRLDAGARPFGRAAAAALSCPVALGGFRVRLGAGTLVLDTLRGGATVAALEAPATLALPTGGIDSVRATGPLGVDLLRGTVTSGAIAIRNAFRVAIPATRPALRLEPRQARLDSAGLALLGDGEVLLGDGVAATVRFEELVLDPADGRVRSGRATFADGLGLQAQLGGGGTLTWSAVSPAVVSAVAMPADGVRLRLPSGASLEPDGFRIVDSLPAAVRLGDERLDGVAVPTGGAVRIAATPMGIAEGRLSVRRAGAEVGTLDARGFLASAVFAARTLPARLALGDSAAGYLVLRTDAGATVETQATDTALHVFTRPGTTAPLVLPGLAAAGGVAPTTPATVDLWLDPRTLVPRSGTVATADENALVATVGGVVGAVQVRRVTYARRANGFTLEGRARLTLPAAFGQAVIERDSLEITASGLASGFTAGRLGETYDPSTTPLTSVALGTGTGLDVLGVRWTPGTSTGVTIAAALTTPLFAGGSTRHGVYFTVQADGTGLRTTLDQSALEARQFPSGRFAFQPASFGGVPAAQLALTLDALTLTLRGTLRLPQVADGFAVSVQDIRLGTAGLQLPSGNADAGPVPQDVRIFGGTMVVRRTGTTPVLQLGWNSGVLTVTLSGDLPVLGRTTAVTGLAIGSDGSLALGSGSGFVLIPALGASSPPAGGSPGAAADPVAAITDLGAANGRLALGGRVVLPAPFRQQQGDGGQFQLELGLDGAPTATSVTVWNQTEGCCDRAGRAMLPLGPMALVHARRLDLTLDVQDVARSSVSLVADAYLGATDAARAANRVAFGSVNGSIVRPGLRVGFDGSVTLGNVALLREFTVGFQSLNLTVKSIAIPNTVTLSSAGAEGDGSPFAFVVSGGLSLNVAQVSGSIAFQDVSIGTRGVGFTPTSLQAATLRVAGVLSLELSDLAIITRDTTVSIAPSDQGGTARSLQVRNLVSFGGRLTLEGSGLSGGVERFLFYQTTAGETALLIKGATLSIPNTVEFRADFEFSQRPDGFLMALGATGTLLEKVSVGMYGMVSNSTTDGLRFGMFLRSTVEIPILPGVLTVAELGGGFFYRPRDVDISNAWQAAGLDPSLRSIGGNVPQNPSAGQGLLFAVMLYGRLNLVSGVASGRTLITITDRYFEILGEVTLLQRQNELVGTIRLQLGITEAYAEGDIRIRVQLAGIITGNAQLAFFVYGPNTWGVIGSMNVRVLNFLNASGKLFIGPPGFLIRLDVRAGFNVSVVKVNTTFRAAVWYVRVGNEVGGFGELSVRAEVFDGLATITATLRGAFLFRSGYSLLYASASVKVETFLGDFSGSIWVKVENGDVDGGLGRDKTMDRLVARAAQVEEMMTQAAQSATAAITEARNVANTISVSTQELSSAFDRFQQQDEYYRTWLVNSAIDLEARTDPTGLPQDWVTARQQYARALAGQLSYEERVWLFTPRMPSVDSLATALDATRQQVIDRLRRTTARIVEVTESPLPDDPEDPLTGDVPDSLVSETITANGTTTKRVASMPTFAVDPAKAAAAVQRTNAWLGLGRVSAAQLRVAIDSLERTLTDVRVLVDDRTDDSFLRYAERYSRARQAMEQYVVASIATARLRLRHADSAVAVMRRITPSLETHVARKTQVIASSGNWTQMRELLAYRATILERVGVPINTRELVTRYLNLDPGLYPSLRSNVDTLGLALWVRLGEQNMPRWRDTLRTRLTGLERGAAVGELEALRRGHAELSAAAAELFDAQGNLYVALRDAYDAYARSFFVDPVREAWQSLPMPTEEFLGILRRRREVRDLVDRPPRPPRITTLANEQMLWSQVRVDIDPQWPLVDAYFVAEEPADGPPNPSYLIGRAQSAWFHVPIPDPAGRMRTSPRAVRVTMRAGAGYALERRMGYDARFLVDAGSFATGVFTTSTTNDPTPPSVPRFQATGGREFTAPWGPFAGQRLLYVPSLDRITMAWSVTSNAGVSAWEIGVGTRADSADILPLRGLAGRTSFTFTGLDAYGGRPLYWRGRARSGDGVLGPFGASAGVVRDTVAPRLTTQRTPTVSAPRTVPMAALPPTNLRLQACRTGRPADQARWFEPVPAPERTIEVSQPTADRAAGVPAVWAWRVDTTTTPGARDTGWTEVTGPSVRISSTRLDYTRPWFVHTRAINPSGVLSNVLVSSPIRLENDRSPATPPEFCQLTTADGGLRLVPSAASRDAASGVRGYQFSVVRGATVLRAFPTGTAIDLAAADWTPETAVTLGTNGTAWRLPPADLDSSAVVVLVRAVNGGGVLSATSAGHVATTKLAPPNPVIDSVRTTISISPVGFLLTARLRHDGRAGETATPFFEYSLTRDAVGDPQWRPASEALRVTWPFLSGNRAVLRVRIRAGNGLTSPIVSQELRW